MSKLSKVQILKKGHHKVELTEEEIELLNKLAEILKDVWKKCLL